MIDPKAVLEYADNYVLMHDRWAAPPSSDVAMRGVVEGLCHAIAQVLGQFAEAAPPTEREPSEAK